MGNGSSHRSPVYTLADHTDIPTQHMAPTQPNSSPATTYLPHQRLGNSHRSPRRQAIPLPDHPGSNGPGLTATEVITRDTSTWQRWEEHGRQFAPWQYMPQYLTRHQDGPWQPITPLQRERLMGFPDHYTQPPHTNITDRSRNTMLGNSWHVPTAIWMLFLLLISAQSASIHPGVQYTNLQKMTTIWNNSAVPWGPPPQTPPHHYMPQMDWTRHLHWAQQHHQNSQQPDPLDPTLHWAIQQQARIPNINEVRANIAMELQSLVSEWADTTDTWFRQLPDHCQRAYRQPKMITQIPLLHHLLQTIQYPHADILFR